MAPAATVDGPANLHSMRAYTEPYSSQHCQPLPRAFYLPAMTPYRRQSIKRLAHPAVFSRPRASTNLFVAFETTATLTATLAFFRALPRCLHSAVFFCTAGALSLFAFRFQSQHNVRTSSNLFRRAEAGKPFVIMGQVLIQLIISRQFTGWRCARRKCARTSLEAGVAGRADGQATTYHPF